MLKNNYKSALSNADAVEKEINNELVEGRYVLVQEQPIIVSALGAIIKKNGSARLIHDASRPEELGLNAFAEIDEKKKFESIETAEKMLHEGYYKAKP